MNRNNRLYRVDAAGTKHFTTVGLLLQFVALGDGLCGATQEERRLSREIVDEIMGGANLESPSICATSGTAEERLDEVVNVLEEACAAIGESKVLEIIHRPYPQTIH